VFFIFSLFANNTSASFLYMANILVMFLFVAFLLLKNKDIVFSKNIFYFGITLLLLVFVLIQPISKTHIYSVLFFSKLMIISLFFYQARLSETSFINFINNTYLFFLIVSVLMWLGIIPNPNYNDFLIKEEFLVSIFGYHYYVLPGIEGSPATIDSYSAIVLLINIFVKVNQKNRKTVVIFALLGILLSFRLTAILGVFLVLACAPLLKKRLFFFLFNISGFVFFLLLLYALSIDLILNVFDMSVDVYLFAYIATHARSVIWEQQIFILLTEYQWFDYIFGHFNVDLFSVPTFQISGAETGVNQSNPHNTYLLLFFRSPLLAIIALILLYINLIVKMDKKYFIPTTFVLLACYTNSALISLENPIYLYVLVFAILGCTPHLKAFSLPKVKRIKC